MHLTLQFNDNRNFKATLINLNCGQKQLNGNEKNQFSTSCSLQWRTTIDKNIDHLKQQHREGEKELSDVSPKRQ